jgi:rod shape-determining protein MreC
MIVASKKPVWATLIVALLFHSVVISLQTSRRVDTSFMRIFLLDSLAPAEKIVDTAFDNVSTFWDRYVALIGAERENETLRGEVNELRMQLDRQREALIESQRLRDLLGLRELIGGTTVAARVIGRDPSQAETVTIDKGSSHGIHVDTPVMTPGGVVGRVIYAGNFFSIVQLIIDSQASVGVLVRSSRRQGIVRGMGSSDLELDYIDDDNDLQEGDELVTSGLDRIYPKGLPVGSITSIGPRVGLFKAVRIRPSADLGQLEEVLCILGHPESVEADNPGHQTQSEPPTP